MVQLYSPTNTNYEFNGDYTLCPIKCILTMKLGNEWLLELENPIDDNAEFIVDNAVVCVNTPIGKNQLFIINETKKNEGTVVATAVPILLANDGYHFDTRIVNKNGQEAGDILCAGTPIKFHSDITNVNSAYYNEMKLNACLGGDNDNSFLNRWGGEAIYKNFDLYMNKKAGSDNGIRAEAGFNLTGISENVVMTGVVTRLRPKAFNGYLLPDNETVDSPHISNYLPRKFAPTSIEYNDIKLAVDAQEGDSEKGITICDTMEDLYDALRSRASKEFSENKIDMPSISYEISIVDVSKTDKFSDIKELVKVSLGDTVHVKNKRLNIETSPRVVEIVWDCVNEQIDSLKLGDYEANFFNDVSSITNSINKVVDTSNDTLMANRITGVINLLNASLRAQKDVAQRQDVRAILFEDLDTKSPTFGALCIGTQGIQIAKKRTPDDSNWQWGTAIDFQSINADYVITGILTDKNGKFYLNLDTGELRMKDGTFVGTINGATINGGTINGSEIKTDKDLYVGNSIRLGYEKEQSERRILSDDHVYIQFGKGDFSTLSLNVGNNQLRVSNTAILMYLANKMKLNISNDLFSINDKNGNIAHTFSDNGCTIGGSLLTVEGQLSVKQLALFRGDLSVLGKKNRIVETENFGHIKLNAVESTYAVFEDYGTGQLDSNGYCEIVLEDKFLETVNAEEEYYAFLTPLSEGNLFIREKNTTSFTVGGTPYMKFDWRVTIKQRGYETVRMEEYKEVQHDNDN